MTGFALYSYIVKSSGAKPPYRECYPNPAATAAVHRRTKALEARSASIYEIQLYLAVLYEGFRPQKKFLHSLERGTEQVAAQAARALEILHGAVRSFQSLVDDLLARRYYTNAKHGCFFAVSSITLRRMRQRFIARQAVAST